MERGKPIFIFALILILSVPVAWAQTTRMRTSSSRDLREEKVVDDDAGGNQRTLPPSTIEELRRAVKAYGSMDLNNRV